MEIVAFIAAAIAAILWIAERNARGRVEVERDAARADLKTALDQRDELQATIARLKREQPELEARARNRVLESVLGVDDDVRRARTHLPDDAPRDLKQGLDLLARDLQRAWERCELERIEPELGDTFDPELHEAIAVTDDPEVTTSSVGEVYSAGFRAPSGALLRPARVRVLKPAEQTENEKDPDAEDVSGSQQQQVSDG